MKLRIIAIAAVAAIAVGVLVAACGDGEGNRGDEAGIRTNKGLAVGFAGANLQAGGENGGTGANLEAAAPAFSGAGVGKGGDAAGFAPAPLLQEGGDGITVQGYGSATADADGAIAEFYFGTSPPEIKPLPAPGFEGGAGGEAPPPPGDVETRAAPGQAQPITEARLQPVIDAIVNAGVSRDDIELLNAYADPYSSSATLRVTVKKIDALDGVVRAARDAAAGLGEIALQGTNISYTVSDCTAMEKAAMQAAVEDASERGAAFAEALGVGLGGITGASHYSYAPFGGSPCDSGFIGPYPLGGVAYAEGQARAVQVFANISVTYAIQ